MSFIIVRHSVENFDKWKAAYDAGEKDRANSGAKDFRVFHGADDSNTVMIIAQVVDMDQCNAFMSSDELKQAMIEGGVIGKPDIMFMDEA